MNDTIFHAFHDELEKVAISRRRLQELAQKSSVPSVKAYLESRLNAKAIGQSPSGRNLGELLKSDDRSHRRQGKELRDALGLRKTSPTDDLAFFDDENALEKERVRRWRRNRTVLPSLGQLGEDPKRSGRQRRSRMDALRGKFRLGVDRSNDNLLYRSLEHYGRMKAAPARPKSPLQVAAQVKRIENLRRERGLPPIMRENFRGEPGYLNSHRYLTELRKKSS